MPAAATSVHRRDRLLGEIISVHGVALVGGQDLIGEHPDNEPVPERSSSSQELDMAGVEEIADQVHVDTFAPASHPLCAGTVGAQARCWSPVGARELQRASVWDRQGVGGRRRLVQAAYAPRWTERSTMSKPAHTSMGSRSQVKVLCSVLTCSANSSAV
jgi:hypothetical protein